MDASQPASNQWEWPATRSGQAAIGLLGGAIVLLFISPVWFAVVGSRGDEAFHSIWFILPLLIVIAAALLSGMLALVAMLLLRERSVVLWFPLLAAVLAMLLLA